VLTVQKIDSAATIHFPTSDRSIDELLDKEWLLSNGRGGYAASTIAGCNTRGYHGLLVGSAEPPVHRTVALAQCLEMVLVGQRKYELSTFEFHNKFAPEGFRYLRCFRRDNAVHFDFQIDSLTLTKSVYLLRNSDTVALVYRFTDVPQHLRLILRPFVALRHFHGLQKSYAHLYAELVQNQVVVRHAIPNSSQLHLCCPEGSFEKDPQWWFNFIYRVERERGLAHTEDLWTPGFFRIEVDAPTEVVLWASFTGPTNAATISPVVLPDIEQARRELLCHTETLLSSGGKNKDGIFQHLLLAADQFIVERKGRSGQKGTTILAGYPWFADWGRDAFISLPGLLLETGRTELARSVLITFAEAADDGMIPNYFDDQTNQPHYNSVDASLWFIHAAFQYLSATGDSQTFTEQLLPVIRWIVDCYERGTRFDIHAEADGLISAGSEQTQLTWMDAKCDGVAVTPRYGKAVEVNALWYNALRLLVQFYKNRDQNAMKRYAAMAEQTRMGFQQAFWNESLGYLNDCVRPDGTVETALRPNQVFAVSLPFSALSSEQQRAVVDVLQRQLLTPYGLRSLDREDANYHGRYTGRVAERDRAYHQGTVWPYLIGPFVEAYLRVYGRSRKSKNQAAEFIAPLLRHLLEDGCLGSVAEIFDGDPPHKPRGCFAQAWSVAELIRAYMLIYS